MNLIDIFDVEKTCFFKGEVYTVRDNGAVYRHKPENRDSLRPLDEKWTFGKKNEKTGYMTIGGHRVHVIVATAFYGANDSSKLVVDHIDTNRCNNRPENLRWLTRLENALLNPATVKRITYLCGGDFNKFLEDPSCLKDLTGQNQDVMWMRTVSAEEAQNSYERIMSWSAKPSRETTSNAGEWIYSKMRESNEDDYNQKFYEEIVSLITGKPIDYQSLSPLAIQRNWKTPTLFPLCPQTITENPIDDYLSNLKIGAIISKNEYSTHFIDEYTKYNDKLYIRTHTYDNIKNFSLVIVLFEGGKFVHQGQTFFEERGAQKELCVSIGKEWAGTDGIDDYC